MSGKPHTRPESLLNLWSSVPGPYGCRRQDLPGGFGQLRKKIADQLASLDYLNDPKAHDRKEQLMAMDIAAQGICIFARRHAELARSMAEQEADPERAAELRRIGGDVCSWVP